MDSGATADMLLTIGSVLERNRLQLLAEDLYRMAIRIRQATNKGDSAEAAVAHSALGELSERRPCRRRRRLPRAWLILLRVGGKHAQVFACSGKSR